MKRFTIYLLALTIFSFPYDIKAQETADAAEEKSNPNLILYGGLQLGIPAGNFSENLDDIGFGGAGGMLFRIADSPIHAGLELGGMVYEAERRDITANIGGFFRDYELETKASIFLGHAVLRFDPLMDSKWRPYLDGMVGFKNLYTRTRLRDLDLPEDDILESEIDEGDWAFSYGGALGLKIQLGTPGFMLDLRCAYLLGGQADYLVRREDNGSAFDDPIDAFESRSSTTDLLVPHIGIVLDFGLMQMDDEDN